MFCFSQISTISLSESNAPTTVVPEVATTAIGTIPCRERENRYVDCEQASSWLYLVFKF